MILLMAACAAECCSYRLSQDQSTDKKMSEQSSLDEASLERETSLERVMSIKCVRRKPRGATCRRTTAVWTINET